METSILNKYKPSGMATDTAHAEGLYIGGLEASQKAAQKDLARVRTVRDNLESVGNKFGIPWHLLAAIASRESHCGLLLDKNGCGDRGNAFGIMQIDKRYHKQAGTADVSSVAHITQAATIIRDNLYTLQRKHPTWPPERQLQGAIAAYNVGCKNIRTQAGIDIGTTHDDYSNDVWARALYFATQ